MTDILVPYSMSGRLGPFSLYLVQIKKSSHDASWIAIADEPTDYDNEFNEKLGHIQEYCGDTTGREIHLMSKGDGKLIRCLTNSTPSVLLGILVAGLRDVMRRHFRSDWKTITVTGDIELRNGRVFPQAVESIPEKYKGFYEVITEDLEKEPEQRHLFLYIKDKTPEELGLKMPNDGHIEVKVFTPDGPLIEVLAYLFEPCFDEEQERLFARTKRSVNRAYKYVPPPIFFELCRQASGKDWRGYIILGERETGKSRMALELAYYLAEREYIYAPIFIKDDYELEKEIIDGKSDNTTSGDNHFTKLAVAIAKRIAEQIGIEGWKPEHEIKSLNDAINKQGKPPYLLFFDNVKTAKIDDIVKAVDNIISICNCRLPMIITIHNTTSFVEAEISGFIPIQPSSLTEDSVDLLVKNIAKGKRYEYKLNNKEKYVQFIELVYTHFASFPGIVYLILSMLNNKEVESLISMLLEIAGENIEDKIHIIYSKIFSEIEKEFKYREPTLLECKKIEEIGYDYEGITLSTMALDFLCVPAKEFSMDLTKEGDFKIWNAFDQYYAEDCSIYLVKNDRMIGYCSICPIEDDCFENSLMNGKEIIRPKMIAPYKPGGNPFNSGGEPYKSGRKFNVYITTISIEHGSESPENYDLIFKWIFQRLKEWENRGILKDIIGISVYSDMLKNIVEQFGFVPKPNKNPIGGTVFECKLEELRWLDLIMGNIEVIKWGEDKKSHGFTFGKVLKAFLEIDLAAFHELAAIKSDKAQYEAYEYSIINRYNAYKDGFIIAHEDGKIVGYIAYFPITEKFYNTFLEGLKVYDYNITSADICGLNENSNYLFIISVAILPKYQKQGISKQLSKMLLDEFSKIKIKDIVALAISVNGEHFLKNINLKEYKDMGDGKKLMRRAHYE